MAVRLGCRAPLVTVLLVWSALRVVLSGARRWAWTMLAALVVGGVLVSTPAAFVCAAIGIALSAEFLARGRVEPGRPAAAGHRRRGLSGGGRDLLGDVSGGGGQPRTCGRFWQAGMLRLGTPDLFWRTWAALLGDRDACHRMARRFSTLALALLGLIAVGAFRLGRRLGTTPSCCFSCRWLSPSPRRPPAPTRSPSASCCTPRPDDLPTRGRGCWGPRSGFMRGSRRSDG